jgi:imidazolonepropionase-like amidohydrolase
MLLQTLLTGGLLLAAPPSDGLVAIRVARAETASHGTIEHAVILVENGKIVAIGQDLPIERGIPVVDRPDWVATPGLVNARTRAGMDGRAGRSFDPHLLASGELYANQDLWAKLLEAGVTTLGITPAGNGISGQAVAVRPHGDTAEEMIVADSVYLQVHLVTSAGSKKMLRDAFEKLDDYDEKVAKAREKWEKEVEKYEKAKKKKKKKKDDDKDDEKDDEKDDGDDDKKDKDKDKDPGPFVAPEIDAKVAPFQALRKKELHALVSIRKASDYLHLLDVIEDEDVEWMLHVPLRDDIDLYEISERAGERGERVVLTSTTTLQPNTRRHRNLPAEFDRAGATVVLLPRSDQLSSQRTWMHDVGRLVAAGLDRDTALAAVTLEAAHVLGLGDRLGSLEVDKDANIVLWSGDPFEPQARVEAVMLEGRFVTGEESE